MFHNYYFFIEKEVSPLFLPLEVLKDNNVKYFKLIGRTYYFEGCISWLFTKFCFQFFNIFEASILLQIDNFLNLAIEKVTFLLAIWKECENGKHLTFPALFIMTFVEETILNLGIFPVSLSIFCCNIHLPVNNSFRYYPLVTRIIFARTLVTCFSLLNLFITDLSWVLEKFFIVSVSKRIGKKAYARVTI